MAQTQPAKQTEGNSPGIVILQWLTYAFWGWLILGLIWLMAVVLINAVLGDSTSEAVPYAVAASVVILPIAFLCDLFYRKQEPQKKTGAAMVIMVIHAVLFALFAIGTLIATVFIGVNTLVNPGDSDGEVVALLTCLFAAILYGAAFVRTLNPFKAQKRTSFVYSTGMLVTTIVLLVLAIAGPLVTAISTRNDRIIENGVSGVSSAVARYADANGKLPASLDDVRTTSEDAQTLISEDLVEYIPEGKVDGERFALRANAVFRYQLCVEYKGQTSDRYAFDEGAEYSTYPDTSSHPAGEVCYKLETY